MRMARLAVGLLVVGGCGGGSPAAPAPSSSNPYIFNITAAGVGPQEVTAAPGTRVLFINSDSRRHDMASDPQDAALKGRIIIR